MKVVAAYLDETLFTLTDVQRDRIVVLFTNWFNHEARLKPLPDLADRISETVVKLQKMARDLEVAVQGGKIVVKVDADSEALLSLLRRGSSWFDPHPDVDAVILAALVSGL